MSKIRFSGKDDVLAFRYFSYRKQLTQAVELGILQNVSSALESSLAKQICEVCSRPFQIFS